jgi:UDP-glucuronate decarboxylase
MSLRRNTVVEQDLLAITNRDLPWETLSGRRVVVTGGGGFLGGYLVRTLLALHRLDKVERPLQVVALVRHVDSARARLADLAADRQLEFMQWDLSAIAVPDIGAADYVLHAASHASPRYYGVDPVGTLLPNTVGTAALLEALRRSPAPQGLLFVSSVEVYGTVAEDVPLDETRFGVLDPTMLRACYAESKRLGETLCVAWSQQHQLATYIVRPFHTYGPGLLPSDGRVFADFAFSVLRGENIVMTSDGSARRAFCYASDAIAGMFAVLLKGQISLPYNVANPAGELSVLELAELMVGLFPDKQLRVERRALPSSATYLPSVCSRMSPDVTRLNSLGWNPDVMPPEGFRRMIEAYQI